MLGPTLRFECSVAAYRTRAPFRPAVRLFVLAPHDFLAMWWWRHRGIVAMSSANFDGQVLGRVLAGLGYGTTTAVHRAAACAAGRARREMERGHDAAFSADGPARPALRHKSGPAQMARRTGCPISVSICARNVRTPSRNPGPLPAARIRFRAPSWWWRRRSRFPPKPPEELDRKQAELRKTGASPATWRRLGLLCLRPNKSSSGRCGTHDAHCSRRVAVTSMR